ncbi:DUF1398 domain-containing protein [Pedobacter nototheniae]|uniref:DUF1398 domain-containing protein n=1 Tax=Pedobacter nototheniae TaxID=2488994 RepID=UPI00103FE39C|nr:DUF1398 family protein [Pedobacter nototheniae]
MFTIEEIKTAESKIKTGADFPNFVREIKALGVKRNDVYVSNGLSIYFGEGNHTEQGSPENYPDLIINEESSAEKLQHALIIHQRGETDYFTFCKQAADAGVEKWVIETGDLTVVYLDSEGNVLIKENIPVV